MYIHEAIEEAEKIDGYITGGFSDCSDEYFLEYSYKKHCYLQLHAEDIGWTWRPVPEELITNKWRVVTKDEFLEASKEYQIKFDREIKERKERQAAEKRDFLLSYIFPAIIVMAITVLLAIILIRYSLG